jgi:hypothetical protein
MILSLLGLGELNILWCGAEDSTGGFSAGTVADI